MQINKLTTFILNIHDKQGIIAYLSHKVCGRCRRDVVHSGLMLTVYRFHKPNSHQLNAFIVSSHGNLPI
jgi:hypothetical protein